MDTVEINHRLEDEEEFDAYHDDLADYYQPLVNKAMK